MAKDVTKDIIGKKYNSYEVISYEGKNKSGVHTYKIRFLESGNIEIRTRPSVLKGELKDVKASKKETKKKTLSKIKTIGKVDFDSLKEEELYRVLDKNTNTLILDQSTNNTGYCIIANTIIDTYGSITTKTNTYSYRIIELIQDIDTLCKKYNIKNIVLEDIYLSYNVSTYKQLALTIGAILTYCYSNCISLTCIPNPVWRKTLGIIGKRDECKIKSLRKAIEIIGSNITSNDISDAICIAEHILITRGLKNREYSYEW